MKKIIIAILAFTSMGYSQSKSIEIPTDKRIIEYKFAENGNIFIQLGTIFEMVGTPQNKNLLGYNSDLTKTQDYDLSKVVSNIEGSVSNNGKIQGFYKQGATVFSAYTSYFFGNSKENELKIKNPIKEVINIINSDTYQVFFGSTENRKDRKILKGEEFSNLHFFRVNSTSLETKLIKIDFPKEAFLEGKFYYQYVGHTDAKMYFVLNVIQNDNQKNICTLVSYDYDGKLVDKTNFTMTLTGTNYFSASSNYQKGNRIEVAKGGVLTNEPTGSAYIQIKVDAENNCFYSYGLLEDGFKKRSLSKGFFIYKYDFAGNLIWKIEKENRAKKDTQKNYNTDIDHYFTFLNNNQIGYSCKKFNTDSTDFFSIDAKSGEIKKETSIKLFGTREPFIKISRTSSYKSLENSIFYIDDKKHSKNVRMDTPTVFATTLSQELDTYINSNPKSSFTTNICPNGIFLIEEKLEQNMYKLLKFNW